METPVITKKKKKVIIRPAKTLCRCYSCGKVTPITLANNNDEFCEHCNTQIK